MKSVDIKNLKAAKKYSSALFQSAMRLNSVDKVYNDIVFIAETINTNEQLKNALLNPVVAISDKKDIVNRLFSIHIEKITLNFTYLIIENNRLECLNEIINCYNQLNNNFNNVITPVITSAIELDEEQKNRIITKLEGKTKKAVIPEYVVNSEIIGGIIIEIGDKTIDLSIKTKFENMRKQLTKGNNYGNN